MPSPALRAALLPALLAVLALPCLTGCGGEGQNAAAADVPPPIADCEDAYACALRKKLPEVAPEEHADLHNVYKLSENIYSGGEPLTKEALERIAAKGVKTILSVDGKIPDAETAKALGMRYVHVPIRYGGIRPDEMAKIAKTFRELPGPFYVHCFHGKHRGPAGAGIGRIVLDGASREEVLAEMRQWCGTAEKYRGLYEAIAQAPIPSAQETQAFAWGFDEAHPFHGVREAMVRLARSWDEVKFAQKRGWKNDPDHPDIDMLNEAQKVAQLIAHVAALDEVREKPADWQQWMKASVPASQDLVGSLEAVQQGEEAASDVANARFVALGNLCASCHKPYRNSASAAGAP